MNNEQHVVIENKAVRIAITVIIAVATGCVSYNFFEGKWHLPKAAACKMLDGAKDIIDANKVIETAAE